MSEVQEKPGRAITVRQPGPVESLELQLEASIKSPPVGRVVRLALLALGLTLIPFFGWATLTTMERAVIASGQLVPEGRRKTVNLLEPGILRQMLVREGDIVDAGQPLLQIDVTMAEAQANQYKAQYWSGRAHIARLSAEAAEKREITWPADVKRAAASDPAIQTFLDTEQVLFQARWQAYEGQIAVAQRQIAQYREQIAGVIAQRNAAEVQIRSVREQIAGLSRLLTQGFAARFQVLDLQRTEAGYQSTIGQANAQQSQLTQMVGQAEAQLAAIRLNRLSDVATELQTSEGTTATALQQLRSAQDVLNRREVLAPEAGKVTNVRAFTPGSSIGAGEPILDLVPVRDRFVVEAQVQPVDIEQVGVGQRTNTRLTSYRVRRLPLLPGRVITVAPDVITTQSGAQYYLLRADLDPKVLDTFPEVLLSAGMPCEVYVLGEKRTPLDYLWSPIRNSARRMFRD